jgi:hypothetical protein
MQNRNDIMLDTNTVKVQERNDNAAISLDYTNGDQKLSIRVYFTRIMKKLFSSKKMMNVSLNRGKVNIDQSGLFYANGALHLGKKVTKKVDGYHHHHFIDMLTGVTYCTNSDCNKGVTSTDSYVHMVASPVQYFTRDEFVLFNNQNTTNDEKVGILYDVIQRANEEYQSQMNR